MITALLWIAPALSPIELQVPGPMGLGFASHPTALRADPGALGALHPGPPPQDPFGAWVQTLGGLTSPSGVAYDAKGRLYVSQGFGAALQRFDAEGTLDSGFEPSTRIAWAHGIALGPGGLLFVSDASRHCVHVLDETGAWVATHGGPGGGPGEFLFPAGLDVHGDRLAVADSGNHRVQILDLKSGKITEVGQAPGPARRSGMARNGELARPADVAFAEDGRLFVADTSNHRVQVFDLEGGFLRGWGGFGSHVGLFSAPTGIDLHGERLHVVDRDNHRIQVFGLDGAALEGFGIHALRPHEGEGALHDPTSIAVHPSGNRIAIAEPREDRVQLFGRHPLGESGYPEGAGEIPVPLGGAAPHYGDRGDCKGTLLVMLEPETHRITCHDTRFPLERPIRFARLGDHGSAPLEFKSPVDLALDPNRPRLYVSDRDNHRIQVLDLDWDPEAPPGNRLFGFARFVSSIDLRWTPGAPPIFDPENRFGLSATVEPGAIDVDGKGRLYLCDERSGRVLVFGPRWNPLQSSGPNGAAPGRFGRPVDVVAHPEDGTWWVVDAEHARIHTFEGDGHPIRSIELPPIPTTGLDAEPFSMAVTGEGHFWVNDRRAAVIRVFSPGGETLALHGGPGLGAAQFHRPGDLLPRSDGGFWALDPGNHRFQGLDAEGAFLEAYGASLYVEPTRGPR